MMTYLLAFLIISAFAAGLVAFGFFLRGRCCCKKNEQPPTEPDEVTVPIDIGPVREQAEKQRKVN